MAKQLRDPASGKKVFSKEFKSGQAAAKNADKKGMPKALKTAKAQLKGMEKGTIKAKPGQKSFLRGFIGASGSKALARKAPSAKAAASSGS